MSHNDITRPVWLIWCILIGILIIEDLVVQIIVGLPPIPCILLTSIILIGVMSLIVVGIIREVKGNML